MSRSTKLTPELHAELIELIRQCVPVSVAARSVGISYASLKAWRARAKEEPDSIYAALDADITQAVAEAEVQMVQTVRHASATSPQYATWMLERRFGGRWSAKQKIESKVDADVTHAGSIAIYVPSNGRDET